MLTEEQRAERLKYIGGSDAAAVLGLSRWGTPLQVWAEKTGQVPPKDLSDNFAVEMGIILEDIVCNLFTIRTGKKVHRVKETIYHPKYPFIAANLDRRVVGENAIFEAKTCGAWAAKQWEGEEIPQEYIIQCLHYLACRGADRAYLAVLIGGNQDFKWKVIERDDKLIEDIIQKEVYFWREFVEKKVMPAQVSMNDTDVLYNLFPQQKPELVVEAGDEANALIENIEALKQDKNNVECQLEQQQNALKAIMKEAETLKTNLYTVTWKAQSRTTLDAKTIKEQEPTIYDKYKNVSSTRVLRIKENKKGD